MKQYREDDVPTPEWSIELEKVNEQYFEGLDNINELLTKYAEDCGLVEPFFKPEK